jgi:methylmalonyl-CoA/ethylmalonyl-CoA epimerase
MIDPAPRPGLRDSRIAFIHPRSTGGVLTEIVEAPAG